MSSIAVIDYGMGNLHSVAKALNRVTDMRIEVTSDAELILRADRVVLPGVGAMRDCMGEIKRLGLDSVIHEVVKSKPFLGVCVGMQALMDFSEENEGTQCLGIIPGTVQPFARNLADPLTNQKLKVPHMGWNQVYQLIKHPLWKDIPQDSRFYFVHSYYVQPATPDPVAASTAYGHPFASALARDNVFAVQFHPEKSQQTGLTLYHNFVNWNGESP
ncbi:MAG: imidazole glycerol phosphate synthase subunit HisH [Gammaproteobacteria bacterium]|nr:imidazole glycerol phosphate synthase subunit HisH [Gammaproteobacteria bacterium]